MAEQYMWWCATELMVGGRVPGAAPVLLFSTPFHASERANMTVFTSADAGLSWKVMQQIDAGPSAYSALIGLNDTHVGLVYESGAYGFLMFRTVSIRTARSK